jgi:hypothetical protein
MGRTIRPAASGVRLDIALFFFVYWRVAAFGDQFTTMQPIC